MRIIRHKDNIIESNPCENNTFDIGLRSALTFMFSHEINKVDDMTALGLRYLRDRISVPRDMPLLSARLFRQALEKIASTSKSKDIYKLNTKHRFDQDPKKFNV